LNRVVHRGQEMPSDREMAWPRKALDIRLKRFRRDWDKLLLAILGLVAFVILWHVAAVVADEPALPTPGVVVKALVHSFDKSSVTQLDPWPMQQHMGQSLKRILYGSVLAISLAVPLGLLMGFSRRAEAFLIGPVELIRPIPPIAWLAFAIAFFAVGLDIMFIIFLGIFFPVFINTMDGVKKVDRMLVDAAQTLGARRLQIFGKVVLPATLPQTMTGVRVGVGVGWMTIVAAEMIGVKDGGLGWFIWTHGTLGQYDQMFAGMLILGILSLLITRGLVSLERWLAR
jgi:NitT/TauT family transport system permease protein